MKVDGETRIFGVVGDPVKQVRTPGIINEVFKKRGRNTICVPLHVSPDDFSVFWMGIKSQKNIIGLGVTVPHKKTAMQHCDTLGACAKRLGVVNVARRQLDGTMHGENFDGQSFVEGLKSQGFDPSGHKIFIYGAGGASKAICFALADAGAKQISIQNRTRKTAEHLVKALQKDAGYPNAQVVYHFTDTATMVINASSLGMNDADPLPVEPSQLNSDQIVAEVVAKPEITRFLKEAGNIGCPTHSGLHMISNQMELLADFIEGY